MQYTIEEHCWQARLKNVRMGCCLDLEDIQTKVSEIRMLKQVHGNLIVGDNRYEGETQEADGLVSDRPGVALVVRTADCVPVHMTDGRRIAVVHAGWRGTEAGIVRDLKSYFNMEHVQAAIGPAISTANYEVDINLYGNWVQREPEVEQWLFPSPNGGTRRMFNLKGLVRRQLLDLGVSDNRISLIPFCTFDSKLPSYRRDNSETARIYNYIYRTEPDE